MINRKISHKHFSNSKLLASPTAVPETLESPASPTSEKFSTPPAQSPKIAVTVVSMIGGHAAVKKGWVDSMGGGEEVGKLGLTKKEIQRQEVIYEVMTTEKDFVEDLAIVIEVITSSYLKHF